MVFQAFGLLPWRTVRDNVGLGLELAGQTTTQRRDKVDQQLALVNLTQWGDRKVGELSGGIPKTPKPLEYDYIIKIIKLLYY
jgi:glycine betaine/proline transport system ATP-binding protein